MANGFDTPDYGSFFGQLTPGGWSTLPEPAPPAPVPPVPVPPDPTQSYYTQDPWMTGSPGITDVYADPTLAAGMQNRGVQYNNALAQQMTWPTYAQASMRSGRSAQETYDDYLMYVLPNAGRNFGYTDEQVLQLQQGFFDSTAEFRSKATPEYSGYLDSVFKSVDKFLDKFLPQNNPNPKDVRPEGIAKFEAAQAERAKKVDEFRSSVAGQALSSFLGQYGPIIAGALSATGSATEYAGTVSGLGVLSNLGDSLSSLGDAINKNSSLPELVKEFLNAGGALGAAAGVGMGSSAALTAAGVGATGSAVATVLAAAGLETAGNAQETYEKVLRNTGNKELAETQALKGLLPDLVVTAALDKIGIFGKTGGRLLQELGVKGASEGAQEWWQQVLSNYLGYDPTGQGATKAFVLGGTIGAALPGARRVAERFGGPAEMQAPTPTAPIPLLRPVAPPGTAPPPGSVAQDIDRITEDEVSRGNEDGDPGVRDTPAEQGGVRAIEEALQAPPAGSAPAQGPAASLAGDIPGPAPVVPPPPDVVPATPVVPDPALEPPAQRTGTPAATAPAQIVPAPSPAAQPLDLTRPLALAQSPVWQGLPAEVKETAPELRRLDDALTIPGAIDELSSAVGKQAIELRDTLERLLQANVEAMQAADTLTLPVFEEARPFLSQEVADRVALKLVENPAVAAEVALQSLPPTVVTAINNLVSIDPQVLTDLTAGIAQAIATETQDAQAKTQDSSIAPAGVSGVDGRSGPGVGTTGEQPGGQPGPDGGTEGRAAAAVGESQPAATVAGAAPSVALIKTAKKTKKSAGSPNESVDKALVKAAKNPKKEPTRAQLTAQVDRLTKDKAKLIREVNTQRAAANAIRATNPQQAALHDTAATETGQLVSKLNKTLRFTQKRLSLLNDADAQLKTAMAEASDTRSLLRSRYTPAGDALPRDVISQAVQAFQKEFPNTPKVVLLEDNAPTNELGTVVLHENGTATIFLHVQNLTTTDEVLMTLLHEAVGHYGIRALFPTRGQFNSLLDDLVRTREDDLRTLAKDRGYPSKTASQQRVLAEEYIAAQAESAPNATIVDRVVAVVRRGLRALGIDLAVSDAELRALVASAKKLLADPGAEVTAVKGASEVRARFPQKRDAEFKGFDGKDMTYAAFLQPGGLYTVYENTQGDVRRDRTSNHVTHNVPLNTIQQDLGTPNRFTRTTGLQPGMAPLDYRTPRSLLNPKKPGSFFQNVIDLRAPLLQIAEKELQAGLVSNFADSLLAKEVNRNSDAQFVYRHFTQTYLDPINSALQEIKGGYSFATANHIRESFQKLHRPERLKARIRGLNVHRDTLVQAKKPTTEVDSKLVDANAALVRATADLAQDQQEQPAYWDAILKVSPLVKMFNDAKIDLAASYGRLDPQAAKNIKAAYKYYVPFQTGERTTTSKSATGKTLESDDIFARMQEQLVSVIQTGIENVIHTHVWVMNEQGLLTNPDGSPLFRTDAVVEEKHDVDTGEIFDFLKPVPTKGPGVMVAFVNGKGIAMQTEDPGMVTMLQGPLVVPGLHALSILTRIWAVGKTGASIPFSFVNFFRDALTGLANLPPEFTLVDRAKFAVNLVSSIGVSFANTARQDTAGGIFGEARDNGAFIDFRMRYLDHAEFTGSADSKILPGKKALLKQAAEPIESALTFVSRALENATRLAVYMTAKEKYPGDPTRAGVLGKTTTLNFERKGRLPFNQMWAFANASLQGNRQVVKQLRTNPYAQGFAISMLGLGMLQAFFGYKDCEKDAEGKCPYDLLPDYKKNKMMGVLNGAGIPVPLEYVMPFAVGQEAIAAMMSQRHASEAAMNVARIFDEQVNFINNPPAEFTKKFVNKGDEARYKAWFVLNTATPTVFRQAVNFAANIDDFGRPIIKKRGAETVIPSVSDQVLVWVGPAAQYWADILKGETKKEPFGVDIPRTTRLGAVVNPVTDRFSIRGKDYNVEQRFLEAIESAKDFGATDLVREAHQIDAKYARLIGKATPVEKEQYWARRDFERKQLIKSVNELRDKP